MDADILRNQIMNNQLDPQVRVANLNSMADLNLTNDDTILLSLIEDESEEVRATSFDIVSNEVCRELRNWV